MWQIQGPEKSGQEIVVCLGFKCQMLWPWNIIHREIFRYVFFIMDPFNVCLVQGSAKYWGSGLHVPDPWNIKDSTIFR